MLSSLKEAFSQTDDPTLITDDTIDPENAKILFANEAFLDVSGYSAEEFTYLATMQSGDIDPQTLSAYKKARRDKSTFQGFVLAEKKSGEYYWTDVTMTPYYAKQDEEWYFIHKLEVAEEYALIKDSAKMMELTEMSVEMGRMGHWELYPDSDKAFYSKGMYEILGLEKAEVFPSFELYRNLVVEEDQKLIEGKLQEIIEMGDPLSVVHRIRRADTGELRHMKVHARSKTKSGSVKIYGILQDVTSEVHLRDKLEESRSNWQHLLKMNPDPIMILRGPHVLVVNQACPDFLNIESADQMKGMHVKDLVVKEDYKVIKQRLNSLKQGRQANPYHTFRIKAGDSDIKYWRMQSKPIQYEGEDAIMAVGQDITDEIQKQKQLEELNGQKEVLIKEIHHRVKNNMAIVSGLLDLQKSKIKDPDAIDAMRQSQLRIQTMAQIHEQLYQEEDFTGIKSSEYVSKLIERIEGAYGNGNVQIKEEVQSFHLNVNQAVPFGLLLNEIIANVFKHAFPNGKEAILSVQLNQEDQMIHAHISDNGVGLPEEVTLDHSDSLGFTIIRTLVQQLEAEIDIDSSEEGTSIKISFERKEYKGSASNFPENVVLNN